MSAPQANAEFLVVAVGGNLFGIATARVETVVACQRPSPLPFVPAFVEGLVNINERIVPQIGLLELLEGRPDTAPGEIVLVDTAHTPCALRVTRIAGKVELAADALQPISGEGEVPPVLGRFTWEGASVLVLDTERIGGLISPEEMPEGQRGLLGRVQGEQRVADAATLDCVVTVVNGERYALALTDIVEILDLPVATPVPGAPVVVEGLAMVRDEVLLVLSLARLLQLDEQAGNARRSVVVVRRDGVNLGLRVDTLDGIRQLGSDRLRRIEQGDSEVSGVLATGDRLCGLLTPERLLGGERLKSLLPLVPKGREARQAEAVTLHTVLQVALGDESFGIPLDQVRRIAEFREAERVQGEGLVTGAVNIGGRVLPVVDLAAQLQAGGGNDGAWVIVGEGEGEWAIAVRAADGILDIPENALEVSAERGRFVSAIANVEERLLSLLTLAPLTGAHRDAAPLAPR